jgi:hypothetical protein
VRSSGGSTWLYRLRKNSPLKSTRTLRAGANSSLRFAGTSVPASSTPKPPRLQPPGHAFCASQRRHRLFPQPLSRMATTEPPRPAPWDLLGTPMGSPWDLDGIFVCRTLLEMGLYAKSPIRECVPAGTAIAGTHPSHKSQSLLYLPVTHYESLTYRRVKLLSEAIIQLTTPTPPGGGGGGRRRTHRRPGGLYKWFASRGCRSFNSSSSASYPRRTA